MSVDRRLRLHRWVKILRSECKLEFIYDPAIQSRLDNMRIDLAVSRASARSVLKFLSEFAKIDIEYVNQWVWIKLPSK